MSSPPFLYATALILPSTDLEPNSFCADTFLLTLLLAVHQQPFACYTYKVSSGKIKEAKWKDEWMLMFSTGFAINILWERNDRWYIHFTVDECILHAFKSHSHTEANHDCSSFNVKPIFAFAEWRLFFVDKLFMWSAFSQADAIQVWLFSLSLYLCGMGAILRHVIWSMPICHVQECWSTPATIFEPSTFRWQLIKTKWTIW